MEEIKVNYTPAVIQIDDRTGFENYIVEVAKKYDGYIVTAETFKQDKAVRADLNRLIKQIDDNRKTVKRDFNQPLNEFETWLKSAVEPLTSAINVIDTGIKELEEMNRIYRVNALENVLAEKADAYTLDIRLFNDKIQEWAKKATNFTKDFAVKQSVIEEMDFLVEKECRIREEREKNRSIISTFAFDNNLSDTPYLRLLEEGKEVNEVLEILHSDTQREKERAELLQAEQARKQAEQQEQVSAHFEKEFLGAQEPPQAPQQEQQEQSGLYPAQLSIAITLTSEADKERFKQLLLANGFAYDVLSFRSV